MLRNSTNFRFKLRFEHGSGGTRDHLFFVGHPLLEFYKKIITVLTSRILRSYACYINSAGK